MLYLFIGMKEASKERPVRREALRRVRVLGLVCSELFRRQTPAINSVEYGYLSYRSDNRQTAYSEMSQVADLARDFPSLARAAVRGLLASDEHEDQVLGEDIKSIFKSSRLFDKVPRDGPLGDRSSS
jgi:hypothetical protein